MRRFTIYAGLAALIGAGILFSLPEEPSRPGCAEYLPADQALIAHAGGGLPDRSYANTVEALELAYRHGHRMFEMDFLYRKNLTVGHDDESPGDPLAAIVRWFADHPDAILVTDLKDGNTYLNEVAKAFGTNRVIPQIYDPGEFDAVRAMGFERIIFTAYLMERDDWVDEINALDLWAVTMPVAAKDRAARVNHPVFLHTVNEPMKGFGLYTDCLVPAHPPVNASEV